jgi:hypothetical protein
MRLCNQRKESPIYHITPSSWWLLVSQQGAFAFIPFDCVCVCVCVCVYVCVCVCVCVFRSDGVTNPLVVFSTAPSFAMSSAPRHRTLRGLPKSVSSFRFYFFHVFHFFRIHMALFADIVVVVDLDEKSNRGDDYVTYFPFPLVWIVNIRDDSSTVRGISSFRLIGPRCSLTSLNTFLRTSPCVSFHWLLVCVPTEEKHDWINAIVEKCRGVWFKKREKNSQADWF